MTFQIILTFCKSGRSHTRVVPIPECSEQDARDAVAEFDLDVRTAVLRRRGSPDLTLTRNGVEVHDRGSVDARMSAVSQTSVWRKRVMTWLPTSERAQYA